jgi:TIR domain
MTQRHSYDVYLSYSIKDRDWVSAFSDSLRTFGVSAWFDFSSLVSGENLEDRMQEALRDSRFLVVILSSNSVDSPWTFFELGAAIADRKTIIPVVTGDVRPEQIPSRLRQIQFLWENSPYEAGKRVAAVIDDLKSYQT